jgi:hypothetical protein
MPARRPPSHLTPYNAGYASYVGHVGHAGHAQPPAPAFRAMHSPAYPLSSPASTDPAHPFPVPAGAYLAPGTRGTARHRDAPGRPVGKSVVVTTTRGLVLVGLVAGGFTEVSAATTLADASPDSASGAVLAETRSAIDVAALPGPAPFVEDAVLLRNAREVLVQRRAAAAAREKARAKARAEARAAREEAKAEAVRAAVRDPRGIARILVSERGWSSSQFTCLDLLWKKESGWNYRATNPVSGAYGIPQALPGRKMASAGSDWRTNPVTQITWGLGYIADIYSTPCGAWSHSKSFGWY